jgi:hypothetical protein
MLELEELKNKYIKYSEEITEDTFNKILDRAKEFAEEICPDLKTYRSFDDHSFDSFRLNKFFRFSGSSCSYGVDNNSQDAEEIKVSDILGEETKFEIGDYVVSLINTPYGRKKGDLLLITEEDSYRIIATKRKEFFNGTITNDEVAESLRKATQEEVDKVDPPKAKEFDRNWYVKVSSQAEWLMLCDYLEKMGEKVSRTDDVDFQGKGSWPYVIFNKTWQLKKEIPSLPQKQLSDILPNYSKVNRNIYYEVENQEQYLEILDWLESKGEFLHPNSRKLEVTNSWKYVVFNLSIPNSWALRGGIPNLPKAEFQFKNKDIDMSKWEELVDVEAALSTYKYPITPEKCYKPIPEIGTEIKFISSKEEPQIEIPKLKVITNKIDLLTLKN